MRPALATHHSPYARPALAAHRGGSMRPLRPSDIRKRLPLPRTAAVIPHATVPLVANTLVALTAVTKGGLRSNGTSHMAGLVAPGLDPGATHIFSRSGRRNRLRRTPRSACRGSGRTSPIDARDVAEVIAAILVSAAARIGKVYELTGPRSQDMGGIAAEILRSTRSTHRIR